MSDPVKSSASGNTSSSAPAPAPGSDTYKGWLFKWTNYLKGYQRRWFVLSNGLLSYYRYPSLFKRFIHFRFTRFTPQIITVSRPKQLLALSVGQKRELSTSYARARLARAASSRLRFHSKSLLASSTRALPVAPVLHFP